VKLPFVMDPATGQAARRALGLTHAQPGVRFF